MAKVLRRSQLADVPVSLFVLSILFGGLYGGGYAAHHVIAAPAACNPAEWTGRAGIAVGATALLFASLAFIIMMIVATAQRLRDDRATLTRLAMGENGFRLVPAGGDPREEHAYRGAQRR